VSKYKSLESLGIPYNIEFSNKLSNLLMRIAECKPFFKSSVSHSLKVNLLRNAKVKAITYSNQIEGNPLKEEDVQKLIYSKKSTEHIQQIEIQNYADALDFLEKLALDKRFISINDFCDIQKLVTSGLLKKDQVGRIRTIPVSIVNVSTGNKIDSCPEPHMLKEALKDLWQWQEDTKEINPYARAFAFHFIAIAIHPFADGNGRTIRLMQHFLLLHSGEELARYIPSETAIMKHRKEYYAVICQTKKLGRLTPMLEFLADCFCEVAESVTKEARKILRKESYTPENRQHEIIKLVKKKKEIQIKDVIKLFSDVPRRTLERDMKSLCEEKKLKAKGEKKARAYILNGK